MRYHLRSDAARLPVPDGGDGLVQSVCAVMETVEQHGCGVLSGGAGGGAASRTTGDLQHGPRVAVHSRARSSRGD